MIVNLIQIALILLLAKPLVAMFSLGSEEVAALGMWGLRLYVLSVLPNTINYVVRNYEQIIHPEGTRTRTGALGPFKDGGARIALETGMTIIPAAISGGYEIWPYDRTLPETRDKKTGRKRTLTISFCPEVQTIGRNEEDITAEVREKIASCLNA